MTQKFKENHLKQTFKQGEHLFFLENHFPSFPPNIQDKILYSYFSNLKKEKWSCELFEAKLANCYPDVFVKAVQRTQAFLLKDKIAFLAKLSLPSHLRLHQKTWIELQKTELALWQKIETFLSNLSQLSLKDALWYCTLWIENTMFAQKKNDEVERIGGVYSFFIQAFLSKYPSKTVDITTNHFNKRIIGSVDTPLDEILNQIQNLLLFQHTVLSEYSFDKNIQLKLENGIVYFCSPPKAYYKWKLDGTRYPLNSLHYFLNAMQEVVDLEDLGKLIIPKGKFKNDEAINRELQAKKRATLNLMSDLKINTFPFDGKQINIEQLLLPLLAYSTNLLHRYIYSLEIHKQDSINWNEAFVNVSMEAFKKGVEVSPCFFMTDSEYLELNRQALDNLPTTVGEELIKLFSFKVNPNSFDRFNVKYDVMKKPFLRLGNKLFCPMVFFARNNWFYTFAQAGIECYNQKRNRDIKRKTAIQMEKDLAELFRQKGFKVKHIENKIANEIKGDVDVIVEDGQQTLFIQLKRTYFSLYNS